MTPYEEDDIAALIIAQVKLATDDTDGDGQTGRTGQANFTAQQGM
jgi:hypothetical protein